MTSSSSDISEGTSQPKTARLHGRGLPYRFAQIKPEWQEKIAICVGSGPSLTFEDFTTCFKPATTRIIAVNDAIRLAWQTVDVLYAPDGQWWKTAAFDWQRYTRRSFSLDPTAPSFVELLNFRSRDGLSLDPTTVHTGGHGGYQAINLAAHFRPRRIVLLGYDMCPAADGRHHFFGDHPDGAHINYAAHLGVYHSLRAPLASLGIEIVNASRVSAITAFPRVSLADALRA